MEEEWVYLNAKNKNSKPYVISLNTLVLEPIFTKYGMQTKVLESERTLTFAQSPLHNIKSSCRHYGHSFENAVDGSKRFLRKLQKPPIVIAFNYGSPITFFPTLSPSAPDNVWIALHAVSNIRREENACKIDLTNGTTLSVRVSSATIYRQTSLGNILEKEHIRKYKNFTGFLN